MGHDCRGGVATLPALPNDDIRTAVARRDRSGAVHRLPFVAVDGAIATKADAAVAADSIGRGCENASVVAACPRLAQHVDGQGAADPTATQLGSCRDVMNGRHVDVLSRHRRGGWHAVPATEEAVHCAARSVAGTGNSRVLMQSRKPASLRTGSIVSSGGIVIALFICATSSAMPGFSSRNVRP